MGCILLYCQVLDRLQFRDIVADDGLKYIFCLRCKITKESIELYVGGYREFSNFLQYFGINIVVLLFLLTPL